MDGIPPLLPQHHDDGELHGILKKLYVEHWIGENCLMSEHGPWNPNRRAVEKRVAEIEAKYTRRAKKLDVTFAAGNNSNPFLSAYKSYGMNGIDSLVVGHFGEVNKGFKQLICSLAKVAADLQEAGNITPASSTDHKKERCLRFIQEKAQSCARFYGD